MTTTTDTGTTYRAYMAEVSGHVSALLGGAMHVSDMADYLYRDAFDDGVPARDCAIDAIEADDLASGLYAELQRATDTTDTPGNGATDTTEQRDTEKESSLVDRSLSDVLNEHRPSVRNFAGNLSAPDEYITDGRILLLTEHIRTAGRVKKYRDRTPGQSNCANVHGRIHRSIEYKAIKQVIPDFSDFVPASYFGCATRPGGTSLVFKVGDTRQYLCLDADLFAIVADVYAPAPVPEVLVHPAHPTTGPAVYLPYWYRVAVPRDRRKIYGLIMPVRHRIEHPQLSN